MLSTRPRMKIFFALGLCLLASCVSASKTLVGEWRYADPMQSCHYVFNQDGSFNAEVTYQHKLLSQITGKWRVEGRNLLYQYISDARGTVPPGSIDRDKLLNIQPGFFEIEAADGSRRTYVRMK
jgi:hypothetical protein